MQAQRVFVWAKYICVPFYARTSHAYNLMQARVPASKTHTCTKSHTRHDVCLNNHFLVQLWAAQRLTGASGWFVSLSHAGREPFKVCFGLQGDVLRTPEFLTMVCTLLHPMACKPWNVWHTCMRSHWWERSYEYVERECKFSKNHTVHRCTHFQAHACKDLPDLGTIALLMEQFNSVFKRKKKSASAIVYILIVFFVRPKGKSISTPIEQKYFFCFSQKLLN